MGEAQGGYLQMFPMYLPEGMTLTHMTFAMLPWVSPSYGGVVGTTTTNSPEPVMAVTFEWPLPWMRTLQEVPKPEHEALLVRRFSADQALATGVHAFSNVRPGPDPNRAPDTTVDTDQGKFGVESTCLTLRDRRQAQGLFQRLRQRVLEQEPAAFTKLAGCMIYVWFENPGGPPGLALPLKKSSDQATAELLQELADYTPQPAQMWVPGGRPPSEAPPLPLAATPDGAKFYATPLIGSVPGTMLYTVAGFELGLAYTSILTAQAAWDEIQRLVDQHDQVGVDILLITSGGPNRRGQIFPAEEAVANFLLENPLGLNQPPNHIKRVILHSWTTGHATELHPGVRALFGPLYQTFQPEHYPIVVPQARSQVIET